MATNTKEVALVRQFRGVDVRRPNDQVMQGAAELTENSYNVDISPSMTLLPRPGYIDKSMGAGNKYIDTENYFAWLYSPGTPTTIKSVLRADLFTDVDLAPTNIGTTIATNVTLTDVVFYQNFYYFIQSSAGGAGATGYKVTATPASTTVLANIPFGERAAVIKDRMFVYSNVEHRLYWSKATDFTTWAAPNGGFVYIDEMNDFVVVHDTIFIFNSTSIYTFSFEGDPANGTVQLLTNQDHGRNPVVIEDDVYYISLREDNRRVKVIRAGNIQDVSAPLLDGHKATPIRFGPTMLRYDSNKIIIADTAINNTFYVFDIKLNTWTIWKTPNGWVNTTAFLPQQTKGPFMLVDNANGRIAVMRERMRPSSIDFADYSTVGPTAREPNMYLEFKFDMGDPGTFKKVRSVFMDFERLAIRSMNYMFELLDNALAVGKITASLSYTNKKPGPVPFGGTVTIKNGLFRMYNAGGILGSYGTPATEPTGWILKGIKIMFSRNDGQPSL